MRLLLLLMAFGIFLSCSKKNKDVEGGGCAETPYIPPQTFSFPSWHPDGQAFVFNYIPIAGIEKSPCYGLIYKIKEDSAGFYFMNKDRTGLTKIYNHIFHNASWSPDGAKLVYLESSRIHIIPFNGSGFDTAARKLVLQHNTMTGFPFFNASSDSIYFRSLVPSGQTMLNRIAIDGTDKTEIRQADYHDLSLGADKRFYYITGNGEIWSMDQGGKDVKRELAVEPNKYEQRRKPQYYDGNIYYMSGNKIMRTGSNAPIVEDKVSDFSISGKGEIIYNQFDYVITETNKQNGVLWIVNADGTNKRQLTFNYF